MKERNYFRREDVSFTIDCCITLRKKIAILPIDRRMDKEVVVYIYNGILLSHKKERN